MMMMTLPRRCRLVLVLALLSACGGGQRRGPVSLVVDGVDGGVIDVQSLRGEVVVLHFFTVGSLAAVADVEQLNAADARDDVTVVGVALDPDGQLFVDVWADEAGADYRLGLGTVDIVQGRSAIGRIRDVPTTIVLDRTGKVTRRIHRRLAPGELTAILDRARASG